MSAGIALFSVTVIVGLFVLYTLLNSTLETLTFPIGLFVNAFITSGVRTLMPPKYISTSDPLANPFPQFIWPVLTPGTIASELGLFPPVLSEMNITVLSSLLAAVVFLPSNSSLKKVIGLLGILYTLYTSFITASVSVLCSVATKELGSICIIESTSHPTKAAAEKTKLTPAPIVFSLLSVIVCTTGSPSDEIEDIIVPNSTPVPFTTMPTARLSTLLTTTSFDCVEEPTLVLVYSVGVNDVPDAA